MDLAIYIESLFMLEGLPNPIPNDIEVPWLFDCMINK